MARVYDNNYASQITPVRCVSGESVHFPSFEVSFLGRWDIYKNVIVATGLKWCIHSPLVNDTRIPGYTFLFFNRRTQQYLRDPRDYVQMYSRCNVRLSFPKYIY